MQLTLLKSLLHLRIGQKEQENCICTMMYEGEVYGTAEHLQDVLNNIVSNKWLPAKPGEVVDEQ
jgi:hypothetical protein